MDQPTTPGFARQGRRQRDREASGSHAVRVVAVGREPPDLDRFLAALLALTLADLEGEKKAAPGGAWPIEQSSRR